MIRDMTNAQFRAALKRNGFRCILGGWIERSAKPGLSVGCTYTKKRDGWKLDKRGSLAKAIHEFKEHDAQKDLTK